MPRKPKTMAQHLVETVGFRKTTTILAFIASWGIFIEKHGRPPTAPEHAAFWNQSDATSYRELDLFKLAFKGETDPTAMWERTRANVELAKADKGVLALHLASVPVP